MQPLENTANCHDAIFFVAGDSGVVMTATSGAANFDKVGIMTTLVFVMKPT